MDIFDTLIHLAYKVLHGNKYIYNAQNGLGVYYAEERLYAVELNCAGEEAYALVYAKSAEDAAEKIGKAAAILLEEQE